MERIPVMWEESEESDEEIRQLKDVHHHKRKLEKVEEKEKLRKQLKKEKTGLKKAKDRKEGDVDNLRQKASEITLDEVVKQKAKKHVNKKLDDDSSDD